MGFPNETPIVIVGLDFPAQSAPAIGVFEHNRGRRAANVRNTLFRHIATIL